MSKPNQKVFRLMMQIFELGPESLGNGNLHYEFSPNMNYIAVVGPTNNLKVLDRRGKVKKEIPINSNTEVQSIEWDMDSDTISIVTVLILP